MPHLFGKRRARDERRCRRGRSLRQVCVSREFTKLAQRRDLADRRLAAQPRPRAARRARRARGRGPGHVLHRWVRAGDDGRRLGGRAGAGPAVAAVPGRQGPGGATSTSPPPTSRRSRSGPRPAARCSACATSRTRPSGTASTRLTEEIGDAFIRVELEGRGHSTVTAHRQQDGVDRVLAFFREKLTPPGEPAQASIRISAPVDHHPHDARDQPPGARDQGADAGHHSEADRDPESEARAELVGLHGAQPERGSARWSGRRCRR